jgi:hypothetical protein
MIDDYSHRRTGCTIGIARIIRHRLRCSIMLLICYSKRNRSNIWGRKSWPIQKNKIP